MASISLISSDLNHKMKNLSPVQFSEVIFILIYHST